MCHVMHVTVPFRTRRLFISSLLPPLSLLPATLCIFEISIKINFQLRHYRWRREVSGSFWRREVLLIANLCSVGGRRGLWQSAFNVASAAQGSGAFSRRRVQFCMSIKALCALGMTLAVVRPVSVSAQAGRQACSEDAAAGRGPGTGMLCVLFKQWLVSVQAWRS